MAVLHYVDGLTLEEVAGRDRHVGVGRAQAACDAARDADGPDRMTEMPDDESHP
jgi:hypothetical protein